MIFWRKTGFWGKKGYKKYTLRAIGGIFQVRKTITEGKGQKNHQGFSPPSHSLCPSVSDTCKPTVPLGKLPITERKRCGKTHQGFFCPIR